MTPLRQRMIEDMQVRNFSPHTQSTYALQVSLFARYCGKPPDQLGPEEIRSYQVYLTNEKKLAPGSILIAVAALRFLYKVTLHKDWTCGRHHSRPQETPEAAHRSQPGRGPALSQLRGQPQVPDHPDDLLRRRVANLGGRSPETHRD